MSAEQTHNFRPITFTDKLAQIKDHWQPRVMAELNDYQFKIVKVQGEFVWHTHSDTDEVFIVLQGQLELQFRDDSVVLGPGEMYVVPKGVEHKPVAVEEVSMILVEPKGVLNTGDAGVTELTAENDRWI